MEVMLKMKCNYCGKELEIKMLGNTEIPQKCQCIGQIEADQKEMGKLAGLDIVTKIGV